MALAVTAVVMASPAEAATYTADACTYASNTQCLFYHENGLTPYANDVYARNNNTLDQWKFHGSPVFIDRRLGSVIVYKNARVRYCKSYNGAPPCVTIPARGNGAPQGLVNADWATRFLSFAWN